MLAGGMESLDTEGDLVGSRARCDSWSGLRGKLARCWRFAGRGYCAWCAVLIVLKALRSVNAGYDDCRKKSRGALVAVSAEEESAELVKEGRRYDWEKARKN
jgi:hypothetical protein